VLFGSCATGRHTVASDVDVLVVYSGPHRPDAHATIRSMIGLRGLELHLYTEAAARAAAPTIARIVTSGVDLLSARHGAWRRSRSRAAPARAPAHRRTSRPGERAGPSLSRRDADGPGGAGRVPDRGDGRVGPRLVEGQIAPAWRSAAISASP
jgi:predicted nucleotidyltransferase